MANGDFDEYGQVFQKTGEKFRWSGKGGPLENGDFDEYGEFGKNRDYNMEKKPLMMGRALI